MLSASGQKQTITKNIQIYGPPKLHHQLREVAVQTGYTILLTFEFVSAPAVRTVTVSNPDGTVVHNTNLNQTIDEKGVSIVPKNITSLFHGKPVILEGQEAKIAIAITSDKVFGTYKLDFTNDLGKASLEFKVRQAEAVSLPESTLFTIGFFVPLVLILLLTFPLIVCLKKRGFSVVRMTETATNYRPDRSDQPAGYENINLPTSSAPSNQDQTYESINARTKSSHATPVSYENVEMQIQERT